MPLPLLQKTPVLSLVSEVSQVGLRLAGMPRKSLPERIAVEMNREQQIAKSRAEQFAKRLAKHLRRTIRVRTSMRYFVKHDPEANVDLLSKCDKELTAVIKHIRSKKPPPLPECPSVELWRQGEEFDEQMRIAEWNDLQRRRS